MILISVYFAETGRSYDFKADETVPAGRVIKEMIAMICHREQLAPGKDTECFYLAVPETKRICDLGRTLAKNGVGSGQTLLLV